MRYFLRLMLGMFIVFAFHSFALGADNKKIGVVDMKEFQKNSRAFQVIREGFKKKYEALKQKLDAEEAALVALEKDYQKQSMMLSLDAKEDKKRELDKKKRYYKYLYEDFTQQMKGAEVEATKKIGKELGKVLEKIGAEEGYLIILERRTIGLLYYNDAIDITRQVTEAYDRMKHK